MTSRESLHYPRRRFCRLMLLAALLLVPSVAAQAAEQNQKQHEQAKPYQVKQVRAVILEAKLGGE